MGNCGSFWVTRVKAESPQHSVQSKPDEKEACDDKETASKGSNVKQVDGNRSRQSVGCALRKFNFAELRAATRNFRPDSLLGEGGFGCVFKGWVDEQGFMAARPGVGIVIAVKKLNLEGLQGHKEWLAEVHFLGQLHHPNLVRLLGFCSEDDHRLLVYEFMPRGSLENHLFRRGSHGQALSWAIRIKVAVGAARGLAFLHEAERPVIFRDFKTSNILLNSQFNAKLSDFGLAKDGPTGDNTHVSTRVMGTYGYAAPEYVATGHLTAKSDVYSFGVVLLEILTGRRAVDKNKPYGEQNLVEWAKPFLSDKRKVFRIVDPRLEGQYSMKGAYRAATLALSCLNQEAKLRPTMKEVVQLLEPLLNFREVVKHSHHQGSVQQQAFGPQQPIKFSPRRFPSLQAMPSVQHQQACPRHLYHKYSLNSNHHHHQHHHYHSRRDSALQCQHGFLHLNCSSNEPLPAL
ncbi:hypothetical protein L7F22_021447 [Adiantum nelumboides]|nr:hypothetical protein [Adiantum nelumboides]